MSFATYQPVAPAPLGDPTHSAETASAVEVSQTSTSWKTFVLGRPAIWLPLAIVTIGIVALQITSGAYAVERSNYSDESAHFMNGLLVRDYIYHALGHNPFTFAERYYIHYPKIAPGMWPPLFHVLLGIFLLPGWPPQAAALALVAACTAWLGWRLSRIAELIANPFAGVLAACVFLSTPIILEMSSAVMVDIAVAVFGLEAAFWLGVYLSSERRGDAIKFGIATALCCLSKGSGISSVLVPIFAILLTGRLSFLRKGGLYVAAAIVLVIAGPFDFLSYRLDAGIGDFVPVTTSMTVARIGKYSLYLLNEFGWAVLLLAALGAIATLYDARSARRDLRWTLCVALVASIAATLLFHAANPHSAIGARYMALAIAPVVALACRGIHVGTLWIRDSWRPMVRALIMVVVAVTSVAASTRTYRQPFGWRDIVTTMNAKNLLADHRVLIVSDEMGEGGFIAEIATLVDFRHSPTIVRGSKLLASDNWNGQNGALRYTSTATLLADIQALTIDTLVVDTAQGSRELAYWNQVQHLLSEHAEMFAPLASAHGRSDISVYGVQRSPDGPHKKLRILTSAGNVVVEE